MNVLPKKGVVLPAVFFLCALALEEIHSVDRRSHYLRKTVAMHVAAVPCLVALHTLSTSYAKYVCGLSIHNPPLTTYIFRPESPQLIAYRPIHQAVAEQRTRQIHICGRFPRSLAFAYVTQSVSAESMSWMPS
jgi:hypothetical protein